MPPKHNFLTNYTFVLSSSPDKNNDELWINHGMTKWQNVFRFKSSAQAPLAPTWRWATPRKSRSACARSSPTCAESSPIWRPAYVQPHADEDRVMHAIIATFYIVTERSAREGVGADASRVRGQGARVGVGEHRPQERGQSEKTRNCHNLKTRMLRW